MRSSNVWKWSGLAGFLLLGPITVLAALELRFLSPSPDTPVFDQIAVEITVLPMDTALSTDSVQAVELHVDGQRIGQRDEPPYRFEVNVGSENREHRFEAVAIGPDGVLGRQEIITPALKIHDRVQLELQQVYATVTRRNGSRVLDLEAEQFELRDDGEAQEIITFERGDIPFTAILLLDTSISMQGSKLDAALRGAQSFVRGMETYDEAKLIFFADRLLAASEFTNNATSLRRDLETIEAAGGTALNDFLFLALRELDSRQGRRVVILLSDGSDVHSILDGDQVREVAQRSQAQIFWVRLDSGDRSSTYHSWKDQEEKEQQTKDLIQTVAESGGRRLRIRNVEQIEGAFAEILLELREQYALGYYPPTKHGDGRWRRLEIDVKRRGLKVLSRNGYHDL